MPGQWPPTPHSCARAGEKIPWQLQGQHQWPTGVADNFQVSQWYSDEEDVFGKLDSGWAGMLGVCMVVHLFWKQWGWLEEQGPDARVEWLLVIPTEVDSVGLPVHPEELVSICVRADGSFEQVDGWGWEASKMAIAFSDMQPSSSGLMRAMHHGHNDLAEVVKAFLGPGYAQWWRVQCLEQALSGQPAPPQRPRM